MSLLTTAQAGAILGVSRHEVQRLVRLGYLPAQRYGQVWLIQEQDARAYQRGRRGTKRQSALTMVYYQPCRMCPACAVEAREKRLFHRTERR